MCLFPFKNTSYKSEAYKKGIREFDCGCCPECLSKRARLWALRCSAEAQYNKGCMITLTYDNYKRDNNGNIIGELPPDSSIPLSKRDCQLFIKRLRRHFNYDIIKKVSSIINHKINCGYRKTKTKISKKDYRKYIFAKYGEDIEKYKETYINENKIKIKYLLTAERGKRTNRAHYHAILFGVDFVDKIKYKKSDRGNIIYKSATLTKIWNHGICTIDAININSAVARYCTKYCAKDSRADDTFMLVSRNIGDRYLMEKFNGLSYFLDGREYSIPKLIWNKVIFNRYKNNFVFALRNASYKYKSLRMYSEKDDSIMSNYLSDYNNKQRRYFRNFRDSDRQYKRYLQYWKNKADLYNLTRPTVVQRINNLDSKKYASYKQACFDILSLRSVDKYKFDTENYYLPPRYNSALRKMKESEKISHLPAPLVIKGQMTQKNQSKIIKRAYYVKNWLYGDKFVYLRDIK